MKIITVRDIRRSAGGAPCCSVPARFRFSAETQTTLRRMQEYNYRRRDVDIAAPRMMQNFSLEKRP
jgi:hypothetical protein